MKEEKWIHKTLITESQKQRKHKKQKKQKQKTKTKKGERGGCGHAIQIKI